MTYEKHFYHFANHKSNNDEEDGQRTKAIVDAETSILEFAFFTQRFNRQWQLFYTLNNLCGSAKNALDGFRSVCMDV